MKDFLKENGILILVIAILLAALMLVASIFLGGQADPLSNAVHFITTPFRNGAAAVADWVEEKYSDHFETEVLREENERLKQALADMEELAREGEAASKENERLRNLLGLRGKRRDLEFESATVTARSGSAWEVTFTISKGSDMGIERGDCVVDDYGNLVGVISEVGINYATVAAVTDSSTDMGGMVERTDVAAILEGDFTLMGEGKLMFSYLSERDELAVGDTVLTSGRGGVYPQGLVVGTVESLHTDVSGMSRYAVIVPRADIGGVRQVFVIKSFEIVE